MHAFVRRDVIFLHPPSVYDFRDRATLVGPISDVVPSSSVFEMYPIGITSIADRLEQAGYHVQVINVAYRMLRDRAYDPEAQIRRLDPHLWAIDLHWLPHVDGALALAAMIKRHHPDTRVLMGGLSASYFHAELIQNPDVDFVVRGDSTEEPVLALVKRLQSGGALQEIPNLTWKRSDGSPVVNPLTCVPDSLDAQVPAYRYIMRSVFKYANLYNIVPYLRWLEHPMTALLTSRGCTQRCAICGGSRDAYRQICRREHPAVRSPERLLADIRFIRRFSRAPVFVIHDLRMFGQAHAQQVLECIARERVDNELVLELFAPAGEEYLSALHAAIPQYSLELTLESHDEDLRRLNGKFACTNQEVEETIAAALKHGCRRLDLFFMVGIPRQTPASALASIDYARELLERFGGDGRLHVYVAPLAPFLDPGSRAFESPEAFGYRLRARTLEEHRQLLAAPTWGQILNYASQTMTPEELVETTYEATARLTQVKRDLGLMRGEEAGRTLTLIDAARRLFRQMEAASRLPEPERAAALAALSQEAGAINRQRVYAQSDFISWTRRRVQIKPLGLMLLMGELFCEELSLAWRRFMRRRHIWTAAPPPVPVPPAD